VNSELTEKDYKELREDFRMYVNVPFSFHILDDENTEEPGDIDKCLNAIETDVEGGKLLAQALRLLNKKINTITKRLEGTGQNAFIPDTRNISLSVGGVGFKNEQVLASGQTLRLVLALPSMPDTVISTLGSVIRSEERSDKEGVWFEVAAKFHQIDDKERRGITRFLFDAQRRSGH
jgi:hypothetical protein